MDAADYFAIQNLIHTYPTLLDKGDLVGVGLLFADADVHFPGLPEPVRSDPAAVTKMFADFVRLYDGSPRTRHIVANLIIEPDGPDAARATSAVVWQSPISP